VDIFLVPIIDKYLIYAPLHNLVALVDCRAVQAVRAGLQPGANTNADSVRLIVERLRCSGTPIPVARTGNLDNPLFLGLIPTRGCNLGCRYCDFAMPKLKSPVMDWELARGAVEAYLQLLHHAGKRSAEVHFFGGEPFFAESTVHFIIEYASLRASQMGMAIRFEVTTNGLYNTTRCQWIADRFSTVVLSLDGPSDIQENYRPSVNGRKTFETITRNAKIFSAGAVELIIRVCVTNETVARMTEIAGWIGQEFLPSTVSYEALTMTPLSQASGLIPPDPWMFARNFDAAARILDRFGIETVLSSANLHTCQASFCPVGKDALIVSPDGSVAACYLLEQDWERGGVDMQLGRFNGNQFEIDAQALQAVRAFTVHTKRLCTNCLCRYHCAGGCHVNHRASAPPGQYDDLCIQTRLITIANLLKRLNQHDLVSQWMEDRSALEASAWQRSDRLCDEEQRL
jgi:uncharacterized protein